MVRSGKRIDASVVFIGEDEVPLLKSAWSDSKISKPKKLKPGLKSECFPSTFVNYLFSESSVVTRLLTSLCPPFGRFKRIPVDASGSFLSCFILACTLYWGYVNSKGEQRVNALFLSSSLTVGYLVSISGITWVLSLCTKTIITLSQLVAVMSYGLFGHALTLIICTFGSDHWFMPMMTIIGGLGSLRICLILLARTQIPACRFVLCTPIAIIHLLFLVYLHFTIMKSIY